MERRYRKARPDILDMPWGTLDVRGMRPEAVVTARKAWTSAAFQEHRTGAACASTLRALIEARAPIDLVALAARFPLDELAHVELCARLAMELGGGTEILHDPDALIRDADRALPPLLRAADLVVRFFCVGEALSIPLLHGTWRAATQPLPRAVLGRIVQDEAAHGIFGFTFLDWALPDLDDAAQDVLRESAADTIREVRRTWDDVRRRPRTTADEAHALGWLETDEYLELASRSLEDRVLAPLRDRGLTA